MKTLGTPVTEIRVGNWFDGIMVEYFPITKHDFENWEAINCLPIPLTPAILEECGFERSTNSIYFDNYKLPNGYGIVHCLEDTSEDAEGRPYHEKGHFYCAIVEREIKYLHRLQNLIWEICDLEITVNL